MVYCSVLNCKNGHYNRPDLAYFTFPKLPRERLDVWLQFCCRNDRSFRRNGRKAKSGTDNNLRICSVHFRPEQLKKSLTGRCRLIEGANPEIFCPTNPQKTQVLPNHSPPKRPYLGDEVVVVNKIRRVSGEMHNTATYSTKDVFNPFIDHSYCEGQKKDKDVVDPQGKTSRACQTDLTIDDWRLLQEEADRLKIENAELLKKCCNKAEQKRNFFYDDVVKSDESVKFYTGIPSHSCLLMLFDVHNVEAQKLKYWDKNKNRTVCYEKTDKKKPFHILY